MRIGERRDVGTASASACRRWRRSRSPLTSPARSAGLPGSTWSTIGAPRSARKPSVDSGVAFPIAVPSAGERQLARDRLAVERRRARPRARCGRCPARGRRASAVPASCRRARRRRATTRSPARTSAAAAGVSTAAARPAARAVRACRRRRFRRTAAPRAAGWRSDRRRRSRSAARPIWRLNARGRSAASTSALALVDHLHVTAERDRRQRPLGLIASDAARPHHAPEADREAQHLDARPGARRRNGRARGTRRARRA